jgi:phosphoribosyl 1,2-cyclic phosphate phosphodiesterase
MKVFFLGTGSAEGLPAIFCDCDVCTEAKKRGGPDRRTRSTILIDSIVKIDLPPDTLAHVHAYPRLNLGKLQHLLFTHSHDDHFAVRELQYLSPNFAPCRKGPLNVYGTSELIKKMLPEMEHFFEKAPLRFHSVLPFDTFSVGHLEATPIVAHHKHDELCLNYLIEDGERTLLYACDTGWYDSPTWEYLAKRRRIHAAILECGKGISPNGYDGHMNVEDAVRFRQRLVDDGALTVDAPVYLTHICHTGQLLHEELSALVAPHGLQVAFDGLEVTV